MDAVHNPESRIWISEKIHLKSYFAAYQNSLAKAQTAGTRRAPSLKRPLENKNLKLFLTTRMTDTVDHCDESDNHDVDDNRNVDHSPPSAKGSTSEISDELLEEINQICDINNLTVPGELQPMQLFVDPISDNPAVAKAQLENSYPKFAPSTIPESSCKVLKTLKLQQQYLDCVVGQIKYKRSHAARHQNNNWFEAAPPVSLRLNDKMIDKEIILAVRLYRPLKKDQLTGTSPANLVQVKYTQEIHLLGNNRLSELRDLIKCPADLVAEGEISENPPWKSTLKPTSPGAGIFAASQSYKRPPKPMEKKVAKEIYKSGFFYIEGCFYNDMRWPDCIDLSETVRNWADNTQRHIGPFVTAKMEDTVVENLEIRLGYPYVYVHQGDHEHLFSFTEARLFSSDDPQKRSDYPYERSIGIQRAKLCMTCNIHVAKYVTTDNERVPEDPFFFCDSCFRSFNYDDEGKKVGKFKAYQYVDANAP